MLLAAACVMAALASTAQAQRADRSLPPLADLSIVAEYERSKWILTVENNTIGRHPGRAVHSVTVEVVEEQPELVAGQLRISDETTIHTIRDLQAGDSRELTIHWPFFYFDPAPERFALRMTAKIIGTVPDEPPGYQFNNATDHWIMVARHHGRDKTEALSRYTNGDTGVDVVISDRLPQAGGATTFTVKAFTVGGDTPATSSDLEDHAQLDVQVKISLSPGLAFAATQQAPADEFDTSTGIWDVGELNRGVSNALSLPVAVNLTTDTPAALPLEERCLTARVVRAVPWWEFVPSKRLNDTFTACLGEPEALLTEGETALFYYLDCVGNTSAPCTNADTMELLVERDDDYLQQPEDVVVLIQDPQGRRGAKWRTGKTEHHIRSVPDTPGVQIVFSYLPRTYSKYHEAVSDVSPKQRPGAFTILGGKNGTFKLKFCNLA